MDNSLLNINPFDGDFGDAEFEEVDRCVVDVPKCHLCGKRMLSGEIVKKVDIDLSWDFEKVYRVEIFYWHSRCWKSLAPKGI